MLGNGKVTYTLNKSLQKISERIQQRLDAEKVFEPQNMALNKREEDSFESSVSHCSLGRPASEPLIGWFQWGI